MYITRPWCLFFGSKAQRPPTSHSQKTPRPRFTSTAMADMPPRSLKGVSFYTERQYLWVGSTSEVK
jgi:hypothetical protein